MCKYLMDTSDFTYWNLKYILKYILFEVLFYELIACLYRILECLSMLREGHEII